MIIPTTDDLSWQDQALCAADNITTELFFPEQGSAQGQKARAVAVCKRCPVKQECLDYALTTPLGCGMWAKGIWGGTTPLERKQMREAMEADNG